MSSPKTMLAVLACCLTDTLTVRMAHAQASAHEPEELSQAAEGPSTVTQEPVEAPLPVEQPDESRGDAPGPVSRPRAATAPDQRYEVIVTAKRDREDPFTSDRSVSSVSLEELQEVSSRTTPEALWDAPGVFVQQTNHGGGSPIVRGMIGPQVLLLVDGVRLSNSVYRTGPIQYLSLIDPLHVERLEVLRGPGSVLYGSDAMGGVIQVLLAAPQRDKTAGGEASFRYATADRSPTWHGHVENGVGGFAMRGGVSHKQFHDLVAGGDIGRQPHTGYANWSAAGTAVHRFEDGWLSGWYLKLGYIFGRMDDAGRTDKLKDKNSLQFYDNDDHLTYARLGFNVHPLHTSGDVTLSYQHFFERKEAFRVAGDLRTRTEGTRDKVTAQTGGVDLALTTRLINNRLRLQYGLMGYRDWVGAERRQWAPGTSWTRTSDKAYPDDSTYDNYGIHLLASGDPVRAPGGHVVRLSGGYRLHGMAGHAPARADLPVVDFSQAGHVFLASAQYLFVDEANVAVTLSQGFRAPNLQEAVMLGDTGKYFHIPNEDLVPERADTLELVARTRVWRFEIAGSAYISWLRDLIKREEITWRGQDEIDGKAVARNVNGGKGRLLGTEGQIHLQIGHGLSVAGHLTWTWGEEEIAGGENLPLTRIPPLFGKLAARYDLPIWDWGKGSVEAFVRTAGKQARLSIEDEKDVRIPEGGTPGWWTLNLRAGLRVHETFRIGLLVENLLNAEYKYHGSGVYSPGTNVIATVAATI